MMELLALRNVVSCPITGLPIKLFHNLVPLCCSQELLDVVEMMKGSHPQERWWGTAPSTLLPALILGHCFVIPCVIPSSQIVYYWINIIWSFKITAHTRTTCQTQAKGFFKERLRFYSMASMSRTWSVSLAEEQLSSLCTQSVLLSQL